MEFLTSGLCHALLATALLVIVLWIAYRAGCLLMSGIGFGHSTFARIEERIFSLALGMLVLSALIFFLGVTGCLTPSSIALVLIILLALSFARLNRYGRDEWGREDVWGYVQKHPLFCFLTVLVFFLSWIQAIAPPIGNDALAYHLYHAKEFVLRHRIEYLPYSRESLWPYFTETFFMLGLMLEGTILAQLFHWVFYLLTAALVYSFGRRFYDEKTARLAALFFIFTPVAFAQAGHAYVDLVLPFFVFAAAYAFLLYDIFEEKKLLLLAGALAGGAAATKYLGLGAFLVLAALTALRTRLKIRPLFYFGFAAFAACGFWYLHSWVSIGNPVYPFFPDFFWGHGFKFDIGANVGMGNDFWAFLKLPWNMTMHPWNFGGEMIGPLFLMFSAPALLGIKNARKGMVYLTVFGVCYTYFLFTQSQHLRFYLSVAPLLSIAGAVGFQRLAARGVWNKRIAMGALAAVLCLHGAIFIYRTRNVWAVDAGHVGAEEYLMKYERSFEGHRFFKQHLKKNEKYFNAAEIRYFYNPAGNSMICDSIPLRMDLKKNNETLSDYFEREKFDYFWILKGGDPEITAYLQSHSYRKVYFYDFTEKPGFFSNEIYRRQ